MARIEAYLQAGGTPSLAGVAQQTGLGMGLLRRLARQGRITLRLPADGLCSVCGRPTSEAGQQLCQRCAGRLSRGVSSGTRRGPTFYGRDGR